MVSEPPALLPAIDATRNVVSRQATGTLDDVNEITALFTRASKLWRVAADQEMGRHGVRVGQNLVLEVLWRCDGVTPGELAETLHVSTPTVVKSANRMVASGLLTKRRDTGDRRLVRLYLTDHARSVQGAIEQTRKDLEDRATCTLTPAERRHLESSLAKIIAELSPR
jgi:DNA-binding MarR family transcriptional regulator